jgi:beta-N-acetylhexosaminidase
MTANVRQAAGSLLMVGLGGTELTGLERAWLKLVRPAGIILFRRNIDGPRQTRSLLSQAAALCAPHNVRCVDVEGGMVDRLRDALAPMPSAQAVARAMFSPTLAQRARKDGAPSGDLDGPKQSAKIRIGGHRSLAAQDSPAREHGELIAQSVKAFGFNTTLAPVLDLALPASVEVMGTRCAAATAADVSEYARAFLAGLSAERVAGCGKHFPGLGEGTRDSHLETPAIGRTWRQLWREDLEPYRALRGRLPMVMVNHAAYPATKGGERPASASKFWVAAVLRKRIGYRGLILSDDLEMGGILKFMPIEEAAIAAVSAGIHLLEICHSPDLILRAYEALAAEAERSAAFARLLAERARESARKRAKLFAAPPPPALNARRFEALRSRVLGFGERIAKAQPTQETPAA